ncbi:redox-sensitive transcriptional activator SoxR [Agromyces silvae]|uniref:redox-sensitive transcriptional activator SoxR n=1 Tax=Agromyces silvae TaxID=3388266 RepID=UPI00280B2736|nr:redox-sensitive transcriptional activator SoxR [Agromyces protaetiae]
MPRLAPEHTALTIRQVSERSGVAITALRFYERRGLISSLRTTGNHRRYERGVLRRIAVIRVAQRIGIPLRVVRDAFDTLPSGRTPTREDWAELSRSWSAEIDARIAGLSALRDELESCVGCGCLSMTTCALSNPGDRYGADGPGPRRLLEHLQESSHARERTIPEHQTTARAQ